MPGPWGKAIEQLRVAKRWTRDHAAAKVGMTPTTYGRIERGYHTQTKKLQDIADAFGVPIEDVLHNKALQSETLSGNTALSQAQPQGHHEQPASVPPDPAIRELQTQVTLLQRQIARVVAEREVAERESGAHLRAAGARKRARSKDAGKPGKRNAR